MRTRLAQTVPLEGFRADTSPETSAMRRIATYVSATLFIACGVGVRQDPTEPKLQIVASTSLPVQRAIGLQVISQGVVSDVQLLVNGQPLTPLAPPAYAYVWDAGNVGEGTYQLSATARTSFGTQVSSKPVAVVIDRTGPEVVSYAPQPGLDPVPVSAGFTVGFSEPVLRASVSASSVTVLRDGRAIQAALALAADGKSLSIAPAAPVRGAYRVALSLGVTDLAGNGLRLPAVDPVWQRAVEPPGPISSAQLQTFTNAVAMGWSPPVDDGGAPVVGYRVQALGAAASSYPLPMSFGSAPTSPWNIGVFQTGATVGFALSAVTAGGEGPATQASLVMPSFAGTLYVGQTAVPLISGQVLILGGSAQTATSVCNPYCFHPWPAGVYDPVTNETRFGIPGQKVVSGMTSARLADGRVLVAGGSIDQFPGPSVATTAQIYDPAKDSFSPTGPLVRGQCCGKAVLLNDGRMLLGAARGEVFSEVPLEIYDPDLHSFVEVPSQVDAGNASLLSALPDGRVLLAGCRSCDLTVELTALLFDPGPKGAQQFSFTKIGPMAASHSEGTATVLRDGRVLLAGGLGVSNLAEIFDPAQGTFTRARDLLVPRAGHTATLLADGRVLFLGGIFDGRNSAEIYDPVNAPVLAPELSCPRYGHTATELPGNKLLLLGGTHGPISGTCPEEVYALP